MATISINLHGLEGSDYEKVFMNEVSNFKNAALGVDGDDVAACLLCRDVGRFDLLKRLHRREIRCVVSVDELSTFLELEFEPV